MSVSRAALEPVGRFAATCRRPRDRGGEAVKVGVPRRPSRSSGDIGQLGHGAVRGWAAGQRTGPCTARVCACARSLPCDARAIAATLSCSVQRSSPGLLVIRPICRLQFSGAPAGGTKYPLSTRTPGQFAGPASIGEQQWRPPRKACGAELFDAVDVLDKEVQLRAMIVQRAASSRPPWWMVPWRHFRGMCARAHAWPLVGIRPAARCRGPVVR